MENNNKQSIWDRPWDEPTLDEYAGAIKDAGKQAFHTLKKWAGEYYEQAAEEMIQSGDKDAMVLGLWLQEKAMKLQAERKQDLERETEERRNRMESVGDYVDRNFSVRPYSGENERIEPLSGSFVEMLEYGVPEAIKDTMSCDERLEEIKRFERIYHRIAESNGLPNDIPIQIDTNYVYGDAGTWYERGKNDWEVGMPVIKVNPFYTKPLDDDQLAQVVGHELAHAVCCHREEAVALTEAVRLNNMISLVPDEHFSVPVMALERYHEFEADRIGCRFALAAGFEKPKDMSWVSGKGFHSDNYIEATSLTPWDVHPAFAEREYYFRHMDDMEEIPFVSYADRKEKVTHMLRTVKETKECVNTRGLMPSRTLDLMRDCLRIEESVNKKVLPFIRMDTSLYLKRMENLKNTDMDDRIRLDRILKELGNLHTGMKMYDRMPKGRRILEENWRDMTAHLKEVSVAVRKEITLADRVKHYAKLVSRTSKKDIAKAVVKTVSGRVIKGGIRRNIDASERSTYGCGRGME